MHSKYRVVSLLGFLPVLLTAQMAQEDVVPLKNWATPLYWQPSAAERKVGPRAATEELQFAGAPCPGPGCVVSADALTFVAMTPCRIADTRASGGSGFPGYPGSSFGPPSLQAAAPGGLSPAGALTANPRTFPILQSSNASPAPPFACAGIPSIAKAYSLDITVVTAGPSAAYLTAWPTGQPQPFAATLAWSTTSTPTIVSYAAIVAAGAGGAINIGSNLVPMDLVIDLNGYFAAPTDLNWNTAVGVGTLSSNTTGSFNTASGAGALFANTTGNNNTASGYNTLANNTNGNDNTASGYSALYSNTTGSFNTASGFGALAHNTTGNNNTASGYNVLANNTTGNSNTADGYSALYSNTTGGNNTASGAGALANNTTGNNNTASGTGALNSNTTGNFNAAVGVNALMANTTGSFNTASGNSTLRTNTAGDNNIASGYSALFANTTGSNNTAVGVNALQANTTGGNNIAVGFQAARNVLGGNGNNIHIGSQGASGDNGAVRIGTLGTQNQFFVAGVSGITTGSGGVPVVIDINGQLGTVSSSRRFKEDIQDMGEASSGLMSLRPVTFRYKQPYQDGSKPIDYGLIAEEAAQVYPDLAVKGADGQVETVQYQKLTPMLLNELQKQHQEMEEQKETIRLQKEQNQRMEARLAALEALLSGKTPSSTAAGQ